MKCNIYLCLLSFWICIVPAYTQISQSIAIEQDQIGNEYRLSGYFQTFDSGITLLAVRQNDRNHEFLVDKSWSYNIQSAENNWIRFTATGKVHKKTKALIHTSLAAGTVYRFNIDNIKLEFKKNGNWESYQLENSDFELPIDSGSIPFWKIKEGYALKIDTSQKFSGRQSMHFEKQDLLKYGSFKKYSHKVAINKIELYYEVYGQGEPLLLLHGNNESISAFNHQIDEFRKNFWVIAVDSRGQGKSTMDKQKMNYELMAEDMSIFLDHLGLDSVHIVGWSDGGNTGLIMAMNYPSKVKTLTTMGANLNNDKGVIDQKFIRKYRWEIRFLSLLSALKPNKWKNTFKVGKMPLKYPKIKTSDLASIKCPVLIMAGENDLIAKEHTQLIADNIKDSKLVILRNLSHFAPSENPDAFNKEVIQFLLK